MENKLIKLAAIAAVAAGISACGGSTPAPNASNQPDAAAVNSNTGGATNVPNPTLDVDANRIKQNPDAFNAKNVNTNIPAYKPKANELPYGSRYAGDDSIITSESRGKDFYETRVFKSNAVLAKVEKIMDGKNVAFKVYLKNGKVIDVAADKLEPMDRKTPAEILAAAGVEPPVEKK